MNPSAMKNLKTLNAIRQAISSGMTVESAVFPYGKTAKWFREMDAREKEAGMNAFAPSPKTGRPSLCPSLTDEERKALRTAYLASNRNSTSGSLSMAAYYAVRNSPEVFRPEVLERLQVTLKRGGSFDTEILRSMRASASEVARYRDPKAGLSDGSYTEGFLRMATDGSRRLNPGERWVWDDASINNVVVVPWNRGGDKCSERFQCRAARFQMLAAIDCATDFCVGYKFIMRLSDAYNNFDVRTSMLDIMRMQGYSPLECVMEGGAWQAKGTKEFMEAAGIRMIDAKGRPNQKLIEQWFGKLWTYMSIEMPRGQIGRYRGEMKEQTKKWMACQRGELDPRTVFDDVNVVMDNLRRSIQAMNEKNVRSQIYGDSWIPCEAYGEQAQKGKKVTDGLLRYALPINEERVIRRGGMVAVKTEGPFGYPHHYNFLSKEGWRFDGAKVLVRFDPDMIERGAIIELKERFQEWPRGHVIDDEAKCISPAPMLWKRADGIWTTGIMDPREEARALKRGSRAMIGAQVAAFDERGVKAKAVVNQDGAKAFAFGAAVPVVKAEEAYVEEEAPDWAKLEREMMIS